MKKRSFLLLPFLLPNFASAQNANQNIVAQAASAFERYDRFSADFIQNDGKETLRGKIWIERPFKLRVEYENQTIIVSDGARVYLAERGVNNSMQVAINQTPLHLLLGKPLPWNRARVLNSSFQNGFYTIRMSAPENAGWFEVRIRENGFLDSWIVLDGVGKTTKVDLRNFTPNARNERGSIAFMDPNFVGQN